MVGHRASSTARSREAESLSQSQPPQQVTGSYSSNLNLRITIQLNIADKEDRKMSIQQNSKICTKKQTVGILVVDHKWDVVKGAAFLISEGFISRNWDVMIINSSDKNEALLGDQLSAVIKNEFDLILSITPIPLTLIIGGKHLGRYLKKRVAVWFLDSPIYQSEEQMDMVTNLPDQSLFLFVDSQHKKLMREALESKLPNKFIFGFMPFGITKNINKLVNNWNKFKSHETREFDLTILANLDQPLNQDYRNNDKYDYKFPVLKSARFNAQYNKIQSFADAIIYDRYGEDFISILIKEFQLGTLFTDPDEKEFLEIFDSFVKRFRRLSLVQGVVDASNAEGLRVAIYGSGWQQLKEIKNNCYIFDSVPYLDLFKVYGKSRAILNLDPNFSHGVTDRVFHAISVGTAVLTNNNYYANQILHHNFDSLLFNSRNEAIENLKLIKSQSQSLADKARVLISVDNMGWVDRVSGLVNFAESI